MSLTEGNDSGTRLELWHCSILPRTCLLLLGQTSWVMPTTTSSCELRKAAFLFLHTTMYDKSAKNILHVEA